MNKIDLFYGLLIGFIVTFIGCYLFVAIFTEYDFKFGVRLMLKEGHLGKLITLGAVLNIAVFFYLLKLKKELMARGVVLATIILTIITLFV